MPSSLGPAHLLVILVVALVVLGPKRLPEAARQIGKFVAEVRHWSAAVQAEIRDVIDMEAQPEPPPTPPATPLPPMATARPSAPGPATPSPEAARRAAAAEWGLPERRPTPPPAPQTGATLPPEWTTPASSNGDHS